MTEFRGLGALCVVVSRFLRAGVAGPASAQAYPTQNVRMIVPFAPGGPTDVIAPRRRAEAVGDVRTAGRGRERAGRRRQHRRRYGREAPRPTATPLLVVSTGFIVNPSMYAKVP